MNSRQVHRHSWVWYNSLGHMGTLEHTITLCVHQWFLYTPFFSVAWGLYGPSHPCFYFPSSECPWKESKICFCKLYKLLSFKLLQAVSISYTIQQNYYNGLSQCFYCIGLWLVWEFGHYVQCSQKEQASSYPICKILSHDL